jgi:GNAT superfamily N-acetyltransferase
MTEAAWIVRPIRDDERIELARLATESWGSPIVVSREVAHDVRDLPGVVAVEVDSDRWLGVASYRFEAGECELVQLAALERGKGVGTALLDAVTQKARAAGARRVWLTTTNDNLDAIRFYQRRGLRFIWIWRDAVTRARKIKPEIPLTGDYGIAITDEIELELDLS